jgi:N-acyl-D-aspartate/D-glutamate deacylase
LVSDWDLVLRGSRVIDPESGLDADVVVFDPEGITDQASYRHSTRPSAGIRHVLVNGTFVVRDGGMAGDARPGRPVRADPR